jgi:hypothetical protein
MLFFILEQETSKFRTRRKYKKNHTVGKKERKQTLSSEDFLIFEKLCSDLISLFSARAIYKP